MSVYFVNCMLACLLSAIVGYYTAHRKYTRMITGLLSRSIMVSSADLAVGSRPRTDIGNDTKLH